MDLHISPGDSRVERSLIRHDSLSGTHWMRRAAISITLVVYHTAEHSRLARVRGCPALGLTRQSMNALLFVRSVCSKPCLGEVLWTFGKTNPFNEWVWIATPCLPSQRHIPGQGGSEFHGPRCRSRDHHPGLLWAIFSPLAIVDMQFRSVTPLHSGLGFADFHSEYWVGVLQDSVIPTQLAGVERPCEQVFHSFPYYLGTQQVIGKEHCRYSISRAITLRLRESWGRRPPGRVGIQSPRSALTL